MTLLFALLNSGGGTAAEEASFHAPYYIAGALFLVLMAAMAALLAFGKGREHS
jgi:hypothetical protein